MEKLTKGQIPPAAEQKACLDSLRNLNSAIGKYRPQRKVKSKLIEHAEMKEFLGSLRGLANVRIDWINDEGWKKL